MDLVALCRTPECGLTGASRRRAAGLAYSRGTTSHAELCSSSNSSSSSSLGSSSHSLSCWSVAASSSLSKLRGDDKDIAATDATSRRSALELRLLHRSECERGTIVAMLVCVVALAWRVRFSVVTRALGRFRSETQVKQQCSLRNANASWVRDSIDRIPSGLRTPLCSHPPTSPILSNFMQLLHLFSCSMMTQ